MVGRKRFLEQVNIDDYKKLNVYEIKPSDVEKATILNKERLKDYPFWRNQILRAYCLSEKIGTNEDKRNGNFNTYWIGFYDNGKVDLSCTRCGDMVAYSFSEFFNTKDIKSENDLYLQVKLLKKINWLIENNIISLV